MKTLKILIVILIVILAVFLVPPMFMPNETKVEKSMILKASPEVIWEQVNCLKNWETWDVWHQDTTMSGYYEGPECGVGAKNIWKYNNSEEGGTQTIVESREYEYIKTELDFGPMGTATAEFRLEKKNEGTLVTWNFRSPAAYPFVRWVSTTMIKPEVEKSYVKGLQKLEEITMNMKPKPKYRTGEITITDVVSQNALGLKAESGLADIGDKMGLCYGRLMEFVEISNTQIAGMPFAIWYQWEDTSKFIYECAIPIMKKVTGNNDIRFFTTYSGRVVTTKHWGDYSTSGYSWESLMNYLSENNLEINGDPYEIYITDPADEPNPENWITELYYPVK